MEFSNFPCSSTSGTASSPNFSSSSTCSPSFSSSSTYSPSLTIYPTDLFPEIDQKGVDLKIGMDIACMAIRQTVDTIVMITGDSDLVPALKQMAVTYRNRHFCTHLTCCSSSVAG